MTTASLCHGGLTDLLGMTVADVMVTTPRTMPSGTTIGDVLAVLDDDHVHMVLLTEGPTLRGTIERGDVPAELWAVRGTTDTALGLPALRFSSLAGRTVPPAMAASKARHLMMARGSRRSAVVDAGGALVGLLCLKRRLTGFCSDADVAARAAERSQHARVVGVDPALA